MADDAEDSPAEDAPATEETIEDAAEEIESVVVAEGEALREDIDTWQQSFQNSLLDLQAAVSRIETKLDSSPAPVSTPDASSPESSAPPADSIALQVDSQAAPANPPPRRSRWSNRGR